MTVLFLFCCVLAVGNSGAVGSTTDNNEALGERLHHVKHICCLE